MREPKGASEFITEAYKVEGEAGLINFYQKWAADYDEQMLGVGYVSHLMVASALAGQIHDLNAQIFDIGCGTGLTSVSLAERGFKNLDGIDLSPDMVEVARGRGIYRELIVGDVNNPLAREDEMYDGVLSSGTFTHGHVGPAPLDEIMRILRPGGFLACCVHDELWESMGFKAKLESLVADGRARCVSLHLDRYYENAEPEGWFCMYQKT
jgi:predicted TPR repeat methyltransferase